MKRRTPRQQIQVARLHKARAYEERNKVIALAARLAVELGLKAGKMRTNIEGWSPKWHGCVVIDLPSGQVSWHHHDEQAYLFEGLPEYDGELDGHNVQEKYNRILDFCGLKKEEKEDDTDTDR